MKSEKNRCPYSRKLEPFILKKTHSVAEYDEILDHLNHCDSCKNHFRELRTIYNYLNAELKKPINNYCFKILMEIEKDKISISNVLLKPQLLDEMPGERHFTAELVFDESDHHNSESDFDNELPLHKDEVLIRVLQSKDTNDTTLYLYSNDIRLCQKVVFVIPKSNITRQSNDIGKIELGEFNVDNFQNLEIMIIPKN